MDLYILHSTLYTAILKYRDEVLEPIVWLMGDRFIFILDNTGSHTAGISINSLQEEGVEAMNWSASYLDLSLI